MRFQKFKRDINQNVIELYRDCKTICTALEKGQANVKLVNKTEDKSQTSSEPKLEKRVSERKEETPKQEETPNSEVMKKKRGRKPMTDS